MIDYPWIKIIKADASHSKWYSTDLVKIYEYSWSTLSWAINYMSRIVSLSKNCVPNIERPQEIRGNRWPNYFSFWPSEEWSEEWRAKTVEEYYSNSYSEKLNKALKKLKCDTTGEYYKYLRYPQLHKIFGILSHAKYIRWDPWQFEFIWIRNSSWSIEVSPNI